MKTLSLLFALTVSSFLYSQNKVYLITEQFSGMNNTSLDKVVVTNPLGVSETYNITHFMKDIVKHDSEFIKILNSVTSKGYKILEASPIAQGDMTAGQSIFTRTWILTEK